MNNHNLRRLKTLIKIHSEPVIPTKRFNKDLKHLFKSGNYDLSRLKFTIELIKHHPKLSPGYDKHRLIYLNNAIDIRIASDWVLIYKELNDQDGLTLNCTEPVHIAGYLSNYTPPAKSSFRDIFFTFSEI